MFQQLYDIEERGKTRSVQERQLLRQREAAPVWNSLREWLDDQAATQVLPKSKLGQALGYPIANVLTIGASLGHRFAR